jgi:Ca-activated chloride channel homolog
MTFRLTFRWPVAFLLLLLVPLLVAIYLWQRKKRRRIAVRYSSVALVRSALPKHSRWRQLLPMIIFLSGLTSLAVASTRPQTTVKVPIARTSIILAMDVSRSMCATDVEPNRLTVAQTAARNFVKNQPQGTRIGIVAFAGFAELVVEPTNDKTKLISAIDGFTTARGTAIGSATLKSVDAIAAINPDVPPIGLGNGYTDGASTDIGNALPPFTPDETDSTDPAPTDTTPSIPPPKGGYIPDIVVLLTDGANTVGIDPLEAAKQAAQRRVRVYTIGFGTSNPADMVCTPSQRGGYEDSFGGNGGPFSRGGPLRQFLVIDEPTLQKVAQTTGGKYFRAQDSNQLEKVFNDLPKQVSLQSRKSEVSAAFAALGALLVTAALVLSLWWNRS